MSNIERADKTSEAPESKLELAVVDADFGDPVPSMLHGQCVVVLPSGVRCALMVHGQLDMRCHVHRRGRQRSPGNERKVATTVYIRPDQQRWLRGVSERAGISFAQLIRHAIDEFRHRAEAQLGPGETIDTGDPF